MTPEIEARARQCVTPALIEAFRRDGAVCIRQLIGPTEVQRLRQGIDANLAQPSERAKVASQPDDPGRFVEDFCNWQHNDAYRRVIFDSPLSAAAGLGTNQLRITTDILNTGAGWTGSHGFSVIGTDRDDRYLTDRHNNAEASTISGAAGYLCGNANYRAATNLATVTIPASTNPPFPGIPLGSMTGNGTGACPNGAASTTVDYPVTMTFTMQGANSVVLEDPLWYAAKYGSFNPVNQTDSTELPNLSGEWDVERNDGEACSGSSCQDGEPDGYFLARRPELLQKRLEALLRKITSGSNASPAVSSAQLSAGGYLYTASFSLDNLWGTVEAYQLSNTGAFNQKAWDASKKLAEMPVANRQVMTDKGVTGVPFTSAQLSGSASYTALKGSGTLLTDAQTNDLAY